MLSCSDECDNQTCQSFLFRTQCIWCRSDTKGIQCDASHVLPECLGNAGQQVLPPGVVCKSCNNYFGTKIEPSFVRDPLVHVIASFLQIIDPGDHQLFREKAFDSQHPSTTGVQRNLGLNMNFRGNRLDVAVSMTVTGTLSHEYSRRDLGFLSRAVHKIAFESLAWQSYVADVKPPEGTPIFDPLSPSFDVIRKWARQGQPLNRVRPVFRKPSKQISGNWNVRLWHFSEGFGCEVNLFADWYAVSLTSSPDLAEGHLRQWTAALEGPKWLVSDTLVPVDIPKVVAESKAVQQ